MPRGRPVLSRGTKQRKKEFDSKLSAYSLTALNNVIEIAEKAFNKNAEDNCVYLPKVMSRKKQVSPQLIKAYAE